MKSFALSSGLKVNYSKSMMVPLNVRDERLDILTNVFGCSKGSLPFNYLGLPLGTTNPKIDDFLPLIQRVERILVCTAAFLSPGSKLEMVNSVLSSTAIFQSCSLKLPKGVIKQLYKYRKNCLWRGSDLTARQSPKAAWPMVSLPKNKGGLGVLNLATHNDSLLIKFLNKFFSKDDIPWVHLVWENYYSKLPGQQKKRIILVERHF